jgi:hypothetical protein
MKTTNADPLEDALERAPWCLIVPIPEFGFTDPEVIGPFASYEDARNWSLSYPDAILRIMQTPEYVVLSRRQEEDDKAWERPRN